MAEDLNDLELEDDDDSFLKQDKKKVDTEKINKFDTVKFKKDIFALMDEIDKEESAPAKRLNPGIKDILAPFFSKRPKNKQEMETKLKAKGIVPRDSTDIKKKK